MTDYPILLAKDLVDAASVFPTDAEKQDMFLCARLAGLGTSADIDPEAGYEQFCDRYPDEEATAPFEIELATQIIDGNQPDAEAWTVELRHPPTDGAVTLACRSLTTRQRSMPFTATPNERLLRLGAAHTGLDYDEALKLRLGDSYALVKLISLFRSRAR